MIPDNPAAVFPYSDGRFAWSHKRFPNAAYRYITIHSDPNADIADYEPGAIWGTGPLLLWAQLRLRDHDDLTVYTDRNNFPAVRHAMASEGLDWHLFLSVGTDPIVTEYEGMKVRACQEFGHGFDIDHVFEPEWLNRP